MTSSNRHVSTAPSSLSFAHQMLDPAFANVTSWRASKNMTIDLNTTYYARDSRSKDKCKRFFGEQRIPILAGSGSTAKLKAFFGAHTAAPSLPSSPSSSICSKSEFNASSPTGSSASTPATPTSGDDMDCGDTICLRPSKDGDYTFHHSTPMLVTTTNAPSVPLSQSSSCVTLIDLPVVEVHTPSIQTNALRQPTHPSLNPTAPLATAHSTKLVAPQCMGSRPSLVADALLLSPQKLHSPCGRAQAAIDNSRYLETSNVLASHQYHRTRRGSHGSAASLYTPSSNWLKRLVEETKRSNASLTDVQTAKVESLLNSIKHMPRPMSVDSLVSWAHYCQSAIHDSCSTLSTDTSQVDSASSVPLAAEQSLATLPLASTSSNTTHTASTRPRVPDSLSVDTKNAACKRSSSSTTLIDDKLRKLDAKLEHFAPSQPKLHTFRPIMFSDTIGSLSGNASSQSDSSSLISTSPYNSARGASTRKIAAIFGEVCPVDVSVQQIERDGLWSILMSNLPLCYFMLSLLKNHTPEILFFILDASQFEHTVYASNEQMQQAAYDLYALYFKIDAPFELNVSQKVRMAVATGIKTASIKCFSKPMQEMMLLLDGAYTRFAAGRYFQDMKRDLGKHTVLHHEATARKTEALLHSAVPAESTLLGHNRRLQIQAIRGRINVFIKDF
ncbi:hypothetical protein BDV3_000192 [Batrachochytrium dendrobatidis]